MDQRQASESEKNQFFVWVFPISITFYTDLKY